jgi:hypothetical protein
MSIGQRLAITNAVRLNQKGPSREGLSSQGFKVGICEAVQQKKGMNPDGEHLCIGMVGEAFKLGMSLDEGFSDLTPHVVLSDLFKQTRYSEGLRLRTPWTAIFLTRVDQEADPRILAEISVFVIVHPVSRGRG